MMSIHDRVAAARQRLRGAGIADAEADLDARLLAEHVLGWDQTRYITSGHEIEPARFSERYEALVARRAAREPMAYILGRQEFWGLTFEVSPAVLIPRPETELLVETALHLFSGSRPSRVADVCTGSGCVAVALAREWPDVSIVATDVSAAALDIAARNAKAHAVAERLSFAHADVLTGVAGPFDLIVANPPYVAERDRPGLQPEVRDHEPGMALFSGPDGLTVIRRLVNEAPRWLRAAGSLLFEFGYGQDDVVTELISSVPGLTMVGLREDLQSIPRVAIARAA